MVRQAPANKLESGFAWISPGHAVVSQGWYLAPSRDDTNSSLYEVVSLVLVLVAITKHYRLLELNNRHLFPHSSGAQEVSDQRAGQLGSR